MFSRELFLCLTLLFGYKSCNMLSHSDSTKLLVLGDSYTKTMCKHTINIKS